MQNKVLYPFRKQVSVHLSLPFRSTIPKGEVLVFKFQVGGSILAAKLAKERGWAINVGGGFHHCSAEKGGGFCAYADISLCIQFAFVRLNVTRYEAYFAPKKKKPACALLLVYKN